MLCLARWRNTPQTVLTVGGRAIEKSSSPVAIPSPSQAVASLGCASNTNDSDKSSRLRGRHAAVLLFSYFPADPRPRRAAQALVSAGVSIEVICLQNDESEPRHETIGGIDVFRIPIKRCRGSKVRYFTQYSAFILRSFLRLAFRSLSRRYDFVHVHNMPDVLVFGALVPKVHSGRR